MLLSHFEQLCDPLRSVSGLSGVKYCWPLHPDCMHSYVLVTLTKGKRKPNVSWWAVNLNIVNSSLCSLRGIALDCRTARVHSQNHWRTSSCGDIIITLSFPGPGDNIHCILSTMDHVMHPHPLALMSQCRIKNTRIVNPQRGSVDYKVAVF